MAKQIITDEESVLKRQARRRLIGAIALTILVVILLPMLLDSQPPTPIHDIDVQIPDKDKVGEFIPQMVLPPLDANEAVSQAVAAPVITPLLDVKPLAVPPTAEIKPLVSVTPNSEPSPPIKPLPPMASVVKTPKPEVKPKAKAEPKTTTKPATHAHTGFVIQVGAFASADAAKKLQEKLHQQGYPSYTEKAGNKIRVRIGDYPSAAAAEKILRKLEIQGHHPDVINLN